MEPIECNHMFWCNVGHQTRLQSKI